jgi:hypothetical protein
MKIIMVHYSDLPDLNAIYLEDSYLLGLEELPESLRFDMLFVLTEQHPLYAPPKADEQYCYRRGQLIFGDFPTVEWVDRSLRPNVDVDGQVDYGNIDFWIFEDGRFRLGGSWGEIGVSTNALSVEFVDDRSLSKTSVITKFPLAT